SWRHADVLNLTGVDLSIVARINGLGVGGILVIAVRSLRLLSLGLAPADRQEARGGRNGKQQSDDPPGTAHPMFLHAKSSGGERDQANIPRESIIGGNFSTRRLKGATGRSEQMD